MPAALSLATTSLRDAPLAEPVRERLVAAVQHAWGGDGALTPPRLAASVAEGLGLAAPDGLVALVGLFYAAVDLSDDVADGDAPFEARGDAERLLLWLPEAALALDPERGPAALRALHRGGLMMWDGQDRDLAARGRAISAAEAWSIAEGKAGEEIAAVFVALAEAAGEDPAPWRALGLDMGVALQLYTDLVDFETGGRDWDARQPTWPLATALAHPTWGAALADAWAGHHTTPARRKRGAALVLAAHDVAAIDGLLTRIEGHGLPAAQPIVAGLVDAMDRWRRPPAPTPPPDPDPEPAEAHAWAMAAGAAYLQQDPALQEAVERHARPLYDQPTLEAPLFGRLLTAWAARQAGVELAEAWAALEAVPPGAQRYFPTVPEVPLDTDVAGWLLTAGLGTAAVREALEAAVPKNLPTWLGPATGPDGLPLTDHPCIASMASACRGLHAVGSPLAEEAWARTLRTRRLLGPRSPYYAPLVVDALLLDAAVHCGLDASSLVAPLGALSAAAGLSGLLGDLWTTAIATPSLLQLNQHPCPGSTGRALVDGLLPDGGAPAVGGWRTLPARGHVPWFRSRQLTTAWVLRALAACPRPELPRAPSLLPPAGSIASV